MAPRRVYRSIWLAPFLRITDRESAVRAANATVWAAGYLCLSNLIVPIMFSFLAPSRLALDRRLIVQLSIYVVLGSASAGLGWLAWRSHPRWVAILVLILSVSTLVSPIASALLGLRAGSSSVLWPIVLTAYAAAGIRGAWALRKIPEPAEVFD